ncbi:MAG: hypothetical protein AAF970_00520 [Bacteroidota bacterium]
MLTASWHPSAKRAVPGLMPLHPIHEEAGGATDRGQDDSATAAFLISTFPFLLPPSR